MTDDEMDQIISRISAHPDLIARLAKEHKRNFFFSDNFKWLTVTIAIPLSTFLFGQWQEHVATLAAETQQKIEDNRRDLEARLGDARNNVAAMTALLPALADSDPKKAQLALIVLEQLKAAQHSNDTHLAEAATAMRKLIDNLQRSSDPGDRLRGADLQEAYSAATGARPTQAPASLTPVTVASVSKAETAKPRIVYLQVYTDEQRSKAQAVQTSLRDNGIGAPGIENVASRIGARRANGDAQIRYFNPGDLGAAKWLQAFLAPATGLQWSIVKASAGSVAEGQLELWWPQPRASG